MADRLTSDELEAIAEEYEAGATAVQLAGRYGMAKSTVLKLVRAAGVPVRQPRLCAADRARVIELYAQGWPQTEIAAQIGRTPSAVWHILRRAGLR